MGKIYLKKKAYRKDLKTSDLFPARETQRTCGLFRNVLYKSVLPTALEKVNMVLTKLRFLKKEKQ
jgi:hypothetical protein